MRISQSNVRPSRNIDMEVSFTCLTEEVQLMFQLDRDHIVVCFISPALSVDG